jgi:hypothetical protein
MSPSSKKTIVFTAIAMIFLFSACAPAQPTSSPIDISNQVSTAVALTVAAQNAQTQAAASVVPQATNTTLPTQTESAPILASATPIIPTVTAVVIPTHVVSSGGGGGTTVQPDYACTALNRKPRDNTIFRPNAQFDIKWTIRNTGKKTMAAGLDVKYHSGTKLTATDRVELPKLDPGDEYTVDFDAVAPEKEGTYIMAFIVEGGLCYPATEIVVIK